MRQTYVMAKLGRLSETRFGMAFIVALFAALCFAGSACQAADAVDVYSQPVSNPLSRQIRFNLTIENPTGKTLANQVVWLYAPVKRTATQELQTLEVSMPYQIEMDGLGNQIIALRFDQFPPYGTKLVSIRADILMSATPRSSQLTRTDLFLDDEPYIEKSDPAIDAVAASLRAPQTTSTASGIYQWVRSNMHYAGYIADDLGARYAMHNRRGDCTEYAYLAAALARANRIVARTLGGYVMDRNGAPRADEYHNWAEVYVDGTWRLLDAQKENYQTKVEQYVAMRIISSAMPNALKTSHRFRVQGEVTVRMN